MLRSKRIDDYQEAKLEDFKADEVLPVDVHLYFSANRHILVWRKGGEVMSDKFLKKYLSRGMQNVWIHRDDLERWQQYLQASQVPEPVLEFAQAEAPAEQTIGPPDARTEEGQAITELLESPDLSERHKTALAARAARQLLSETMQPQDPALQKEAMGHARDAVRDILDVVLETAAREVRDTIDEIWEMSTIDPGLDHAVNVASFAVLFAMAFGRISPELLGDIALAALLHDVGLTQIPLSIIQTPWDQQKGRDLQIYARHVDEGIRLLDEFSPGLSPRVRPLIQQHHEKFDGTGYPLQLQGFQVNDIAQLLGMADAIESMASGQWDGQKRSLMETFDQLEELEKNRALPQYFNPEVFNAVLRWVRAPGSLSSQLKASDVVKATTRNLMKRARG